MTMLENTTPPSTFAIIDRRVPSFEPLWEGEESNQVEQRFRTAVLLFSLSSTKLDLHREQSL